LHFIAAGTIPITMASTVDVRERVQVVRAGLNYRFNWGMPAVMK